MGFTSLDVLTTGSRGSQPTHFHTETPANGVTVVLAEQFRGGSMISYQPVIVEPNVIASRIILLGSLVGFHKIAAHTREHPPDGATVKCLVTEGVSRCYTVAPLAEATNGTSDAARGLCERSYPDVGSLAALNSPDVRLFVETFVLPGVPSELVWVGGRRGQDTQGWRWVGGHSYNGDSVRPLSDGRGDCGSYRLGNYTASMCDARIARFLCANITLPQVGRVSCNQTSIQSSADTGVAICRDDAEVTWYEARNFCLGLGGDLAALPVTPSDGNLKVNDVNIWVGLHWRPWFWFLENNRDEEVTWTSWGTQGTEAEADCIALNVTSAMWMMTSCNRFLRYAICLVSNGFYDNMTPTAGNMATVTDGTNLILMISLSAVLGILLLTTVVLGVLWGRRNHRSKVDAGNCPVAIGGHDSHVTPLSSGNREMGHDSHLTPSSSGYLEIHHDSHVAARPSSAVVSPYSVAMGADIARREGSDGVQRQGNNRLWRSTEGNTAHAPPGPQARVPGDDNDDEHPYLEPSPSVARPEAGDSATTNGTSGIIPSKYACYLTTSADVYLTTSAAQ